MASFQTLHSHYSCSVKQGNYDQSDHTRFPEYFGRQCCAIAVSAACKGSILNPSLWTIDIIDECIIAGDRLFANSMQAILYKSPTFNHFYLRPDELQKEVLFSNGEKIIFDVNHGLIITGLSLMNDETIFNDNGPTNYSFKDALIELFRFFYFYYS